MGMQQGRAMGTHAHELCESGPKNIPMAKLKYDVPPKGSLAAQAILTGIRAGSTIGRHPRECSRFLLKCMLASSDLQPLAGTLYWLRDYLRKLDLAAEYTDNDF